MTHRLMKINVGMRIFTTNEQTLLPLRYFDKLFKANPDVTDFSDDKYMIPIDQVIFGNILNYLRSPNTVLREYSTEAMNQLNTDDELNGQIVLLNVGGQKYHISKNILENSEYFKLWFNNWASEYKASDKLIDFSDRFIDRSPKLFEKIIVYLHHSESHSDIITDSLKNEFDFYMIKVMKKKEELSFDYKNISCSINLTNSLNVDIFGSFTKLSIVKNDSGETVLLLFNGAITYQQCILPSEISGKITTDFTYKYSKQMKENLRFFPKQFQYIIHLYFDINNILLIDITKSELPDKNKRISKYRKIKEEIKTEYFNIFVKPSNNKTNDETNDEIHYYNINNDKSIYNFNNTLFVSIKEICGDISFYSRGKRQSIFFFCKLTHEKIHKPINNFTHHESDDDMDDMDNSDTDDNIWDTPIIAETSELVVNNCEVKCICIDKQVLIFNHEDKFKIFNNFDQNILKNIGKNEDDNEDDNKEKNTKIETLNCNLINKLITNEDIVSAKHQILKINYNNFITICNLVSKSGDETKIYIDPTNNILGIRFGSTDIYTPVEFVDKL